VVGGSQTYLELPVSVSLQDLAASTFRLLLFVYKLSRKKTRRVAVIRSFIVGSANPSKPSTIINLLLIPCALALVAFPVRWNPQLRTGPLPVRSSLATTTTQSTVPETTLDIHRYCANRPVSGAIAPLGKLRNALCAFLFIVRRIKGFAATVLLKFEWLWPVPIIHPLAARSLPFAPEHFVCNIVVSDTQLDGSSLSAKSSGNFNVH
jgi:hypothetical protein